MNMNKWYERGFIKKPRLYDLTKKFAPEAFMGHYGHHEGGREHINDLILLRKFYGKYPEVKYFP